MVKSFSVWQLFRRWHSPALMGVLVLSLAWLLVGCGGNTQPVVVTYVPTDTPPPSPTETPVQVVSLPQATLTPLPTRPPSSPTPGPSPTGILALTNTPAPATLTATSAPTQSGIRVEYFTTDTESARPGDNVTLFWRVYGVDYARIYRVDDAEERLSQWDVNGTGQLTVSTGTADRDVARFLLEADAGGGTVEQLLLIPLSCPEAWFFGPAPDACPAAPPQVSMEAEQTFERGRMIWVEVQDRIYVIFEDGRSPAWAQYPDNFREGDPDRDEGLVPPPGLVQPVRGFGLIWRTNERVRERLGWATSPEVSFEGMLQSDSAEPSIATLYLRMRDGGIVALDNFTNEWVIIPFAAPAE
ncbi:MAG: hypothetical protein K8S97_05555 [Anaerolineae bacterium]|nr:hypothetical protein [Anaerolineae bacterium]